jgi:hypothetical protein
MLIKEKLMPKARTCNLPNMKALFCIGVEHFSVTALTSPN